MRSVLVAHSEICAHAKANSTVLRRVGRSDEILGSDVLYDTWDHCPAVNGSSCWLRGVCVFRMVKMHHRSSVANYPSFSAISETVRALALGSSR